VKTRRIDSSPKTAFDKHMSSFRANLSLGNATRISIGLILIVLSVLGVSYSLGLIPSRAREHSQHQLEIAKSLAIQFSTAIEHHDAADVQDLAGSIVGSLPDVASIGFRRADGSLIFATRDHAAKWQAATTAKTAGGLLPIKAEIFDRNRDWGQLELTFSPAPGNPGRELLGMFVFVTALCLLGFMLFMRRTLRVLDPSQVVPERVRAMLDTLTEGAAIIDSDGRIVLANQSLARMLSTEPNRLLGVILAQLPWKNFDGQSTDDNSSQRRLPWEDLSSKVDCRGKMVRLETESGFRSLVVNASSILGGQGRVRGCVITFDDVTGIEQKNQQLVEMVRQLGLAQERVQKQNEELQRLATRDVLTGCLNRRAFHEQLATLFAMATRQRQPISAIMLDIDHFKAVNDTYGHARGDEVLRGIADVLRNSVRGADVVCRYGGEEFCILMPATDLDGAFQLAEKLRQAIAGAKIAGMPVTASFGASCAMAGGRSSQALIDQADEALYNSKHAGRNRTTRFDRLDPSLVRSPADGNKADLASDEFIPIHAVRSLFAALSFRDPQTAQHSQRVAEMCVKTASTWLSPRELFILETAALLHDIGKVGVPDAVLLKPGPLTEEEWRLMRQHDRIGVEIVKTAFNCPQLTSIIAHHHARHEWVSQGNKLMAGDLNPHCARLLAIADAYDAMTTHRCYRAAISHDAAIAELRRCAGTQFDPMLVEQFIKVMFDSSTGPSSQSESDRLANVLRLSMEAEMLAGKLLERDLESTAAIAKHLAQTAAALGSEKVSEQCSLITRSLESAADAQTLLAQTCDLLELTGGRKP
jgi:diguanylate cyclase (GGDEF)-like protein/putative nucleotidyltransferase with HDIG domain/PAS domain S-box-containing protein